MSCRRRNIQHRSPPSRPGESASSLTQSPGDGVPVGYGSQEPTGRQRDQRLPDTAGVETGGGGKFGAGALPAGHQSPQYLRFGFTHPVAAPPSSPGGEATCDRERTSPVAGAWRDCKNNGSGSLSVGARVIPARCGGAVAGSRHGHTSVV